MAHTQTETGDLHYLDANRVEHMAGVEVCTGRNEKLGAVDGFLIDRGTRRLRYIVVEPEASDERCLLPADMPAVLDVEKGMLRVEAEPEDLERFSARSGQRLSDDELIEETSRHHTAA